MKQPLQRHQNQNIALKNGSKGPLKFHLSETGRHRILEFFKMSALVLTNIGYFLLICVYHVYAYLEWIYIRQTKSPKSLDNEIILVTGSGRGIGRQICLTLAETKATIVCWSRTSGPNESLVQQLRDKGAMAFAYTVDVSKQEEVERAFKQVKEEIGDVTIVINNAGVIKVAPFLETKDEDIENMYKVNVFSSFWVLRQFLPDMIKKKRGHIVSVCSASALLSTGNITAYTSTKHAINGFMDSLRNELKNHPSKPDIKTTIIYPFYCDTELLNESVPHSRLPFILPIHPPKVVADQIVYGIQRDYEYQYIPPAVGWLAMFSWIVPPKIIEAYEKFLKPHINSVSSGKY